MGESAYSQAIRKNRHKTKKHLKGPSKERKSKFTKGASARGHIAKGADKYVGAKKAPKRPGKVGQGNPG